MKDFAKIRAGITKCRRLKKESCKEAWLSHFGIVNLSFISRLQAHIYARSPYNPEVISVKRVIALEGDLVYTRAPYPLPIAEIPSGHIWVEGDNEDGTKTLDSNHYGPISMNLIVGRITHVLWPLKSYGPVQWAEFKGRAKVIKGRRDGTRQWI